MKPFFLILISLVTLQACGDENSLQEANVYEVKNIGELATTEYTIGKIIKLEDQSEEWYKYGERRILISCKAKVKAGIDLNQIEEGDIMVVGQKITIKLPPVKIISFHIDPNQVITEMEEINGFRDDFTQKEKSIFLKQGELAIREELPETGIIEDANKSADIFLIEFYQKMGFEKVTVIHSTKFYED